MTTEKYDKMLNDPVRNVDRVAKLISWSENYDYPSPFTLFLDLIGWSEQEFGERQCKDKWPTLGYLEVSMLGEALQQYSENPDEVNFWLGDLLAAEYEDDDEFVEVEN